MGTKKMNAIAVRPAPMMSRIASMEDMDIYSSTTRPYEIIELYAQNAATWKTLVVKGLAVVGAAHLLWDLAKLF